MPRSPRPDLEDIPIETERIFGKENANAKTVRPETSKQDKKHNMPLEKLIGVVKCGSVFQRKYAKMEINKSKVN